MRHGPPLLAAIVLATLTACQDADRPRLEECGNGIVEPGASEDCEPIGDTPGCGAVGSGTSACRFICTEQACPEGYRCGLDAICRRPCLGYQSGIACSPFETLSSDVTTAAIAQVTVVDLLGDSRPELLAVESQDDAEPEALARVYRIDDDGSVGGEGTAVGEFPGLVRLDAGGAHHLLAQRGPLPPLLSSPTDAQREVIVSVLGPGPEHEFREVLIQGPVAVPGGDLRLSSYTLPADVPGPVSGSFLLGFGEDLLWQPEDTGFVPNVSGPPDALLGPSFGQPLSADFAAASGHQASQFCSVMLHGYRGTTQLHDDNPCDGLGGWSRAPLTLPGLPAGVQLGDGIALGDGNGDGLDDLAITSEAGRIYVAYAVGDGTFHSDAATLPASDGDGQFDGGVGLVEDPGVSLGVIAVGDYNEDGRPDFITRSTWIRSCAPQGCGTCDVPGYRCGPDPQSAPGYLASEGSVGDIDADGQDELLVLARDADDPFFAAGQWGSVGPSPGDLVIIERPARPDWSARVVPLPSGAALLTSGDLDGDDRDEVVLRRSSPSGDELWVVYGADDTVEQLTDFERIVDAHVLRDAPVLAVVSEDLDMSARRLTRLSADHRRRLRSVAKLALGVVPRSFVAGRFGMEPGGEFGLAVLGEGPDGVGAVELSTRGSDTYFDASTRRASTTSLMLAPGLSATARAVAVDLDGDELDELVVFGGDGIVRTLHVVAQEDGPVFAAPSLSSPLPEPYLGPRWPGDGAPVSTPRQPSVFSIASTSPSNSSSSA